MGSGKWMYFGLAGTSPRFPQFLRRFLFMEIMRMSRTKVPVDESAEGSFLVLSVRVQAPLGSARVFGEFLGWL